MERNTLSVYAWVIIAFILFAVLLAFATPITDHVFGQMEQLPGQVAEGGGIGNKCKHEHTDERDIWVKYSSTQHQKHIQTYCTDCGKVISTTPTSTFENHTYNSSYICTKCQYRHNHIYDTVISKTYEQIAGNSVYHLTTITSRCVCGLTKVETIREVHHYTNGTCDDCGFVNDNIGGCTVIYDANGGTGAPEPQMKKSGIPLIISSTVPTKMYGVFKGWNPDKDAVTPMYQPGDEYTGNTSITLYAVWENKTPLPSYLPDNLYWKGTLTYNGNPQTADIESLWNGYDSGKMIMSGDVSGTNAGSYTATFSPAEGYCWADGTTLPVQRSWTIKKAKPYINISNSSNINFQFNENFTETIRTINTNSPGNLSATSSQSNIGIDKGTSVRVGNEYNYEVLISARSFSSLSTTITFTVNETTNYTASDPITIIVSTSCNHGRYKEVYTKKDPQDLTNHLKETLCAYCNHSFGSVDEPHSWSVEDPTTHNKMCTKCSEITGDGNFDYCVIYFDNNGGEGGPISPVYSPYDVDFTIPSDVPTKGGSTFSGWNGTYYPGNTYHIGLCGEEEETITFVAKWESITITFNLNGGTGGPSPLTQEFPKNSYAKLTSETPTLANYEFVGWTSAGAFSPDSLSSNSQFYYAGRQYSFNSDITLYAYYATPSDPSDPGSNGNGSGGSGGDPEIINGCNHKGTRSSYYGNFSSSGHIRYSYCSNCDSSFYWGTSVGSGWHWVLLNTSSPHDGISFDTPSEKDVISHRMIVTENAGTCENCGMEYYYGRKHCTDCSYVKTEEIQNCGCGKYTFTS